MPVYNNETVRRKDRLLPESRACELLRCGEYGYLSMTDDRGIPYGIPINYVWDGEETVYMHCAPTGHKLDCIASHPEVSFCVVGHTQVIPDKFTTGYESIVVKGTAVTGLPSEERMKALELLLQKYSPNHVEVGLNYAKASFGRTEIIRLRMTEFSGKCKQIG